MFAGVRAAGLGEILASARLRRLPAQTTVFAQGTPALRAYALIKGRVRIAQSDSDGGQLLVRFIAPGETFGTMALFTDNTYPADATTVVDSVEISWTEKDLFGLIARHPVIALNLRKIAGQRLREAQERLRELATQRVEHRVAQVLLRLAARGKRSGKSMAIDFPLARKDVAEMCGATLHTVSRTLRAWEKAGLLSTKRQLVTIKDLAELRRRSES